MRRIKARYFLYAFLCIIIASTILLAYSTRHRMPSESESMHFVGRYSTDKTRWSMIKSGSHLKRIAAKDIYLKGHFTEDVKDGEHLWAQFHRALVTVRKNGEMVYTNVGSIDRENTPFITEWSDFEPGELLSTEKLSIHIMGKNAGISAGRFLDSVCTGDKINLLRVNLQKNIWQICIAVLMICIGIALALTVIALCFTNKSVPKSYVFSGFFLVAGGVCTLIDYNYITLLIPDAPLVNVFDYLSQCLICEFLMLYVAAFIKNKILKTISLTFSVLMPLGIIGYFILPFSMLQYVNVQLPIYVGSVVIAALFLLYEYFKLHNKKTRPLLISGAIISVFIIAEMLNYWITGEYWVVVFQFGLIVYACMQFYHLVAQASETIKDAKKTESVKRELAEAKIDIMLSQIKPHFIYNSLTTISSLCKSNPKEADDATCEFAVYLRSNLESLNRTKPIIFSEELEHIKSYLKLEKRRFTDRLNVTYDIQSEVFRVPALTVQPIVENAVKHGICARETPGNVEIISYETNTHYVIEVKDDGVGFDAKKIKNDDATHIGISNIKSRLASMVSGTLTIESEIGKGTKATIKIPKDF